MPELAAITKGSAEMTQAEYEEVFESKSQMKRVMITAPTINCPIHNEVIHCDAKWATYYCEKCDWDYSEDGSRAQ